MTTDNAIRIEFYGVLTERAGRSTMDFAIAPETKLADVLASLAHEMPEVSGYLATTACAINDEIVQRSATINPGAKLALLPPVSGG